MQCIASSGAVANDAGGLATWRPARYFPIYRFGNQYVHILRGTSVKLYEMSVNQPMRHTRPHIPFVPPSFRLDTFHRVVDSLAPPAQDVPTMRLQRDQLDMRPLTKPPPIGAALRSRPAAQRRLASGHFSEDSFDSPIDRDRPIWRLMTAAVGLDIQSTNFRKHRLGLSRYCRTKKKGFCLMVHKNVWKSGGYLLLRFNSCWLHWNL